jgi:hypothetical protein
MNLMGILKVAGVLVLTFILMFAVAFFLFPHINKDRYQEIISGIDSTSEVVVAEADTISLELSLPTEDASATLGLLESQIAEMGVRRNDISSALEQMMAELQRIDSLQSTAAALAEAIRSDSSRSTSAETEAYFARLHNSRQASGAQTVPGGPAPVSPETTAGSAANPSAATTSPATSPSTGVAAPTNNTAASAQNVMTNDSRTGGSTTPSAMEQGLAQSGSDANSTPVSNASDSGRNRTQDDSEFRDNVKSLLNLDEEELAPIVRQMSTSQLLRLYRSGSNMQREKLLRSLTPSQAASLMREVMS